MAGSSVRSMRTAASRLRSSSFCHSSSSRTAKPPAGADRAADYVDNDVDATKTLANSSAIIAQPSGVVTSAATNIASAESSSNDRAWPGL